MAAAWMCLRAETRRRWRAWLALALLLGIVGGAGIAAAAGARRTETAYPRFAQKNKAYDVILGGIGTEDDAVRDKIIKSIIARPEVLGYTTGGFLVTLSIKALPSGETFTFPEIFVGGDVSGIELRTLNRPKVIRGRLFHDDARDEAVMDFTVVDRLGLHLGQRIELALTNQDTGQEAHPVVRIVGIIAAPWDLPSVGQAALGGGLTVSAGFVRENAAFISPTDDAPSVRLRRGAADIPSFIHAVEQLAATVDVPGTLPAHLAGVRKTLAFEVSALWMLSALIALAALAIVGQALARQAVLDSDEYTTLRAMAMPRRQLFAVGMIRALLIGGIAAAVAVGVAFLASPLTPRGLARVVEPDPGFAADWTVLGIGAAITLTIALVASAIPAWRAAAAHAPESVERGSRFAQYLAGAGAGPSVVAGVRLALEPGRGRRALPVRSTVLGLAVALAAFWAAASFTQSLDHLLASPNLQGFAWDVITTGPSEQALSDAVRGDPDVDAADPGGYTNVVIAGEHLIPFTYSPGRIEPVILKGRAPRGSDEIALGTRLLEAIHKNIGDTVQVQRDANDDNPKPIQTFRVVGTTVVPAVFFQQVEPGFGSAITMEGAFRLEPGAVERREEEGFPYVIRYKPGVDVRAKLEALRAKLGFIFTFQVRQPGSSAELAGVSRSSGLPYTLTQILLFMAAATLIHALVSAVRKRRHDIAILKTLGFSRRQVRSAIAVQATTFVILALVIGLPIGVAVGRWTWAWFVETIGLVPFNVAPPAIAVVLVVFSALLLGNAIALLPGRSAARTKPATVLRTE